MMIAKCVDQAKAGCGEGLLWDETRGCVWWVDISKERLHAYEPVTGNTRMIPMPYLISALALRADGALLIATLQGLGLVDPDLGTIDILHDPEPGAELANNRLNDMEAAPDGSLWVGTMSEGAKGPTGALFRYDADGVHQMKTGTTISNGIDWSPDGTIMYFIDSVPGVLYTYAQGAWSVMKTFDETTGRPDGMCVDREGTLWIAICDQGYVMGLSAEGEITARIDIPCEIVTNCAFGGADLKTLYVTTGTFSMSDTERAANPLAGGLFAIEMDVPGRAPNKARWPA